MPLLTKFLFSFIALAVFSAEGVLFNNAYISFEIPANWKCKPFDVTWVCHSRLAQKKKEAIIILMAKEAGALDNLSHYASLLKKPMTIRGLKKGTFIKSKVIHVKQKLVNGQPWIDGFHKNSKIPGYFTRYMVTKCCSNSAMKLGIIVTLSAHENYYTKYANEFLKVTNSLKILDINETLKGMRGISKEENLGSINKYIEQVFAAEEASEINPNQIGDSSLNLLLLLGGALLSILILLYILKKQRKQRNQKKRK